ncbi:hypothetical protein CUR178_02802 [Leishmania enriettii]|uniref:Uncharacterized protein n=1 Tax=Leishmania enriettii TaxID=5663 RepID=A0A836KDB5_LEIEN|nr:hypothetical protein CUR178_02802 [Leishmania enriettii]
MEDRDIFILILTVMVVITLCGGIATFLRIFLLNRRKLAAQEARGAELWAPREASRRHQRRSRSNLPEAIPIEANTIHSGPVLGNAVIKDANVVRMYAKELVPVDSPRVPAGALASVPSLSNRPRNQRKRSMSNGALTDAYRQPVVSTEPFLELHCVQCDEETAFPEDLEWGGYVIVECPQQPVELSEEGAASTSAAVTRKSPSRREANEVRELQFYRHQTSSTFYGAAQYYNNPRQAQGAYAEPCLPG